MWGRSRAPPGSTKQHSSYVTGNCPEAVLRKTAHISRGVTPGCVCSIKSQATPLPSQAITRQDKFGFVYLSTQGGTNLEANLGSHLYKITLCADSLLLPAVCLFLQGNPCCEEPQFRLLVLSALPGLQLLDHHEVGGWARLLGAAVGLQLLLLLVLSLQLLLLPTCHSALKLSEH